MQGYNDVNSHAWEWALLLTFIFPKQKHKNVAVTFIFDKVGGLWEKIGDIGQGLLSPATHQRRRQAEHRLQTR